MSDLEVGATNEMPPKENYRKLCIYEGSPGVCDAASAVRARCHYSFNTFCLQSDTGIRRARKKVGRKDEKLNVALRRGTGERIEKPQRLKKLIKRVTSKGIDK
jgi:hypothetical protein